MIWEVPLSIPKGVSSYEQITNLEGEDFIFNFYWNQRLGGWYLSLFDVERRPILLSQRLTFGRSLLKGVTNLSRPKGVLYLVSPTNENPLNKDELGFRGVLIFNSNVQEKGFFYETV